METSRVVMGETLFSNPIEAYQSTIFLNNQDEKVKWLYLIGGIHGHAVEGVYILNQLHDWIKGTLLSDIPLILIPILNVDGHQAGTSFNARKVDINRNFPVANKRQSQLFEASYGISSDPLKEPESFYLKKYFDKFPPQLLITFTNGPIGQIQAYGETAEHIAKFLSRYNQYVCLLDPEPIGGSLEAFVYDFYLGPVINLQLCQFNANKSFKNIWNENSDGLKQLLKGQVF